MTRPVRIKKQAHFDKTLRDLVRDDELAVEIDRAICFAISHFPEQGRTTGIMAPVEVFAWPIPSTTRTPALLVYYARMMQDGEECVLLQKPILTKEPPSSI